MVCSCNILLNPCIQHHILLVRPERESKHIASLLSVYPTFICFSLLCHFLLSSQLHYSHLFEAARRNLILGVLQSCLPFLIVFLYIFRSPFILALACKGITETKFLVFSYYFSFLLALLAMFCNYILSLQFYRFVIVVHRLKIVLQ